MTIKTYGSLGRGVCFAPEGAEGGGEGEGGEVLTPTPDAQEEGAAPDPKASDEGGEPDAGADKGEEKGSEDWRDSITDPKLREYADRFTTPEAMAKAHKDLREKLSKAVNAPGEDATDEEVAAYREKMGIPETPDGYEAPEIEGYEQTDADKAYQSEMASILHAEGIPKAAFDKLAEAHIGFIQKQQAAMKEAQDKADAEYLADAETGLRKDWGKDYAANLKYSEEAAKAFFDQDIGTMELKNGQLLGSHPDFIKGMAQIGRQHGEGVIHIAPDGDVAQSLREQADTIRQKRNDATAKGDDAAARRYDKQEREILARL